MLLSMLREGTRVGGLLIHEMVGRGAMGEVYRAEQVNLQRPVAVKRIAAHLADQGNVVARFEREARIVATINSPHVVQVYEFGNFTDDEGDQHLLLVMEWIDGGRSLRQCMSENVGIPWELVALIVEQAAQGLHIAHEQGIVHRDIKPDNMLLSPKGEVKLADFGLANASDSSALTADGSVIGTPNYLSPEACNGHEIGAAGDIYSLGASCFHLLTGCPPFTAATTIALLRAHCEQDIPNIKNYVAEIPNALADLITKCLQKKPEQRFQSAKDMVKAIEDMRHQGISCAEDLQDLLTMADNAGDEASSISTSVDVNAATAVAAAQSNKSFTNSATAETLISADVKADSNSTPVKVEHSDTQEDSSSQINNKKPSGSLAPIVIALLVMAVVGIGGYIAFNYDPIAAQCQEIEKNIASGDLEIAYSIAEKQISEHPAHKGLHQSFHNIIEAEAQSLIKAERFDEGVKRLEEYRKRHQWLTIDKWHIDLLLAKAQHMLTRDVFASDNIYRDLRKTYPKEMRICVAYVDTLGHEKHHRYWSGTIPAAYELVNSGHKTSQHLGDTIWFGYLYARTDGDWTTDLRNVLAKEFKEQSIAHAQAHLDHERHDYRIQSYNFLIKTESISINEELQHHVKNYFHMTSYSDEWNKSHEWIKAQSQEDNWSKLKQDLDVSSFAANKVLTSWSNKQEKAADVIATAFMPEMKATVVDWAKNSDHDNLRFNAYGILKQAKMLDAIDLWEFHKATTQLFTASYEMPRDFTEALDFFKQELKGERAEEAKQVLIAGKKYIEDYIVTITKNGFGNRTRFCKTNIKAIDDALNQQ